MSSVLCYEFLPPAHKSFAAAVSSTMEPKSYKQAIKLDHWKEAMETEIKALQDNQTWKLTDLPPGKTPIGMGV